MIEGVSRFRRLDDTRYRNVGGEGVVVRQRAGEVLVLNEVGARVLDLIDKGATLDAMLAALIAEFDVAPDALDDDVRAYLTELVAAGVIEQV